MQHSKRRNMASPPVSPAPDFASKYEHKFDDVEDGGDAMNVSFGEGEMGAVAAAAAAGGSGASGMMGGEEGEEMLFGGDEASFGSPEDQKFDLIVGSLEGVLMDPEFQMRQDDFCRSHCDKFFDDDENRLEYMPLFEQYAEIIEGFIAEKLTQQIDGFSMDEFQEMLDARKDQICGDIFDLLLSLSDFQEFKDLMLSFKAEKAGGAGGAGGTFDFAPVVTPIGN